MQRHSFDLVSFIFGVIFTGLGITFLSTEVPALEVNSAWIWPVVLLVIGGAVLATALTGARSRRSVEEPTSSDKQLD